jgi:hypothetical protein
MKDKSIKTNIKPSRTEKKGILQQAFCKIAGSVINLKFWHIFEVSAKPKVKGLFSPQPRQSPGRCRKLYPLRKVSSLRSVP